MATNVKLLSIVTNNIELKNYMMTEGNFSAQPELTKRTGKVEGCENRYTVELSIKFTNTKERPFPIDLFVKITGVFEFESDNEDEVKQFLKLQAVQLLFPYLRTMVSNITSTALMNSLLIPLINITEIEEIESKED